MMLDAEKNMLERLVSNRRGDAITIHAGGDVAFAKDRAEANVNVEKLEGEIEHLMRLLDKKAGTDEKTKTPPIKPKNETEPAKNQSKAAIRKEEKPGDVK